MAKLTPTQKSSVNGLAIAYKAYHAAWQEDDFNSLYVWAKALREHQNELGVRLVEEDRIQRAIDTAERKLQAA